MGKSSSKTTKFSIQDIKTFKRSLDLGEKKFKIHIATANAVSNMVDRVSRRDRKSEAFLKFDAAKEVSTIRKAIKNKIITQSDPHNNDSIRAAKQLSADRSSVLLGCDGHKLLKQLCKITNIHITNPISDFTDTQITVL